MSSQVVEFSNMLTNRYNQNKVIFDAVDDLEKNVNTPLTYASKVLEGN